MKKYKVSKLPNDLVLVSTRCAHCRTKIALPVLKADFDNWENGMPVSVAFPVPFYTPGDRKFFSLGLCEDCQEKMFKRG